MNISINWIKDFVELPEISLEELSSKYTMATCEIESITESGQFLTNIIVAQITKIDDHPNSDKLHLVTIDKGNGTQTVVCGAPNVEVGMKVPYAPLGTTFPGDFTLTPKEIRGVLSEGMLCSQEELGLGADNSGLLALSQDATLGVNMAELFDINVDTVIEVDNKSITHRPDLWGHFGQAREIALVFDAKRKDVFSKEWEANLKAKVIGGTSPITPMVYDSCCKAYLGLSIDNVKVAPSPQWMQSRLQTCGIRPINNIVDISNYVMLELGIPMHIYDREKIEDESIIIKRLEAEETFITLDGIERKLIAGDTVITDSKKPLVIAGIMGGENSGVEDNTTKIFVEVANWVDSEVRKTSSRIGLRTDSSQRYEKSLDSQLLERSMFRALELILMLNPEAQILGQVEKVGPDTAEYEPKTIRIDFNRICTVLGKEISNEEIIRILQGLDFEVYACGDTMHITVPSFRATKDIDCDADIIEEIGRIIGYDNIVPTPTFDKSAPVRLSDAKRMHRKIQDFLVFNAGMTETLTYPMIGESLLKKAQWHVMNENLTLVNALSKESDRMRPSLIPSMLEVCAKNAKQFDRFSMFEYGRAYLEDAKNFSQEHSTIAIVLFDKKQNRFMELVNTAERLIKYLNIPAQIVNADKKFDSLVVSRDWLGLHPNETLDIKVTGRNLGFITNVHPLLLSEFKIKGTAVILTLDLSTVENISPKERVSYKALTKFPGSTFDCTVVTKKETPAVEILNALKKIKVQHIQNIGIVDVFDMGEEKAVTIRASYLNPTGTLTPEFLEESRITIVSTLDKAGFPLKM